MKVHLLHPSRDFDLDREPAAQSDDVMADLELDILLQAMSGGDAFLHDVSKKVLLTPLTAAGDIRYRQHVLADCLAHPELVAGMYATATQALEDRRRAWGWGVGATNRPSLILSGALRRLAALVPHIEALRRLADENATRFRSDGLTTLAGTLQRELDDDYLGNVRQHLRMLEFPSGVFLSAGLGADNRGTNYVLRTPVRARTGWKGRLGLGPRSSYSFTLPARDDAGAAALEELTGRGVNLVADAVAQSTDHIASYFKRLRAELAFYVSCLNLQHRLEEIGAPTSFPDPLAPRPATLSCRGLYDVCLALRSPSPVVGNDVESTGRPLLVITGASSGGKSTFLRSVGVAQLMMQCGMIAPAHAYGASLRRGVFTHFSRNEDPSMRSGRLDDELRRMAAIAREIRADSMMLFNESFAATNEREGSEIARQVVLALLDAGIQVFFVTHQYDFAEGFRRALPDTTMFLRAERHGDGRRTFKLVEGEPLPTSFGVDIYHRLGGLPGPVAGSERHVDDGGGRR